MKTLWDSERMTLADAKALTVASLCEHGPRYRHWAIAFSGGKDSSAVATLIPRLIADGAVPAPASLTVLYADTRMELPPLQSSAMAIMAKLQSRGIATQVVLPALDDRFFVYMLGRGVPPPKNRFRWCTAQLKIEPMLAALAALRDQAGEKLLMLTGVRIGESAARDQRIALSCSRDGAECGQGWFQEATPEAIADTLAPILHWRTCHVWDWLAIEAPRDGFETRAIAQIYDQDVDGSPTEVSARTGCVGCNLASRDLALDRVLRMPGWEYLHPLKRLRPLYARLTEHRNRLRKNNDERKADGSLVSNPGRIGPLTLDARRAGLAEVLAIQIEIAAGGDGFSPLIDAEEQARIEELIAANTWPQRWSGDELPGDTDIPTVHADGTVQGILWG